jgi:hypothetical protein
MQAANASLNQVTIKSITLNASGIYRCEILADKSFQALFKEGNFTVIGKRAFRSFPLVNDTTTKSLF